jgi:hypothetical protein
MQSWQTRPCISTCLQVRELSGSLATAQQLLAGAQSAKAADAAAAEQHLKLLQQQLTTAEAGLMRRMTGGLQHLTCASRQLAARSSHVATCHRVQHHQHAVVQTPAWSN